VRREADLASQQIERLTQVIEELVNLRRGDANLMTKLDLAVTIAPVIAESRRALLVQSRALQVRVPRGLSVVAAQGGVRNILAVLLENALEHGRGTVTVAARTTGSWVVLSVADEGEGLSSDIGQLVSSGEISNRRNINRQSIGFPLAVMLAIAQEGRLEWLPSEPSVVRLYLRLSDENEASVAVEAEQGPESDADDIGGDVVSESVVETENVVAQRETAQ
jgi:K+-sensing histidine kinase KdpD